MRQRAEVVRFLIARGQYWPRYPVDQDENITRPGPGMIGDAPFGCKYKQQLARYPALVGRQGRHMGVVSQPDIC